MVEELPTFAKYGNFLIDPNTVLERSGNSLIKKSFLKLEMLLKQLETNYSHEEISKCKLAIQNLKCFVDPSSIKSGLYLQHNNLFQKNNWESIWFSEYDVFRTCPIFTL